MDLARRPCVVDGSLVDFVSPSRVQRPRDGLLEVATWCERKTSVEGGLEVSLAAQANALACASIDSCVIVGQKGNDAAWFATSDDLQLDVATLKYVPSPLLAVGCGHSSLHGDRGQYRSRVSSLVAKRSREEARYFSPRRPYLEGQQFSHDDR